MFWNRNKRQFDVVVIDLENKPNKIKVKAETTSEEIMKELNIQDAYLVLNGMFATSLILKKMLKDGATFYACPIEDQG